MYTASRGTIYHPHSPNQYLPNQDCVITINSPRDQRIVFYFTRMDLERSRDCLNDYLEISEGADDGRTRVFGRYCGRSPPGTIRTDTGVLKIRFKTNRRIEGNGFKASYYFQPRPSTTTTTTIATTTPWPKGTVTYCPICHVFLYVLLENYLAMPLPGLYLS